MTQKEAEYIKKYPEAKLIVAMADSTWAGNRNLAKVACIERGNNQIGVITLWKMKN